jgi:hypothetical protein
MNETYPVIRLEVQGMKHAIQIALSEHLIKMDMDIQSAIDRVCTPTNISAIVFDAAQREIKAAIDQHIQNFYRYGDGREAIKEAVERQLKGESNE